jgi:hypothetical protein
MRATQFDIPDKYFEIKEKQKVITEKCTYPDKSKIDTLKNAILAFETPEEYALAVELINACILTCGNSETFLSEYLRLSKKHSGRSYIIKKFAEEELCKDGI